MRRPVITLTTDFGLSDHFAGTMKGVILGICPAAEIVDISHEVGAFAITEAAFLLAQAYHQQAHLVSIQAEKAIHYDTLKHEVDTTRQLYDALLQRVKHAGLAAAMRASNLLVVDPAKPPLLPYRPNYPMNSALGLLLGTFLGVGVTILRERFNQSIAAPGVAPAYLNLPELGAIPLAEISSASFVRGLFSTRNKLNVATLPLNGSRSGENHLCKASLNKGAAQSSELVMMAEAFRATLASILLPTFGTTPPPRVIVVTSPRPNAGKTTVTSNLGIVMAEMGRRLNAAGLVAVRGGGLAATAGGRERLAGVEDDANTAMRAYVLERPHTATVYGLVAAMQTGRFTLEDLLAFIAEGPTEED